MRALVSDSVCEVLSLTQPLLPHVVHGVVRWTGKVTVLASADDVDVTIRVVSTEPKELLLRRRRVVDHLAESVQA